MTRVQVGAVWMHACTFKILECEGRTSLPLTHTRVQVQSVAFLQASGIMAHRARRGAVRTWGRSPTSAPRRRRGVA